MARRRVLLVMECTIGGTRLHLNQLALGLPRDRFEVAVVASAERDPTFREDLARMRAAGVNAIELPMVRAVEAGRDLEHQKRLREIVRDGAYDLVHSHSSKAGALARMASIRERVGKRVHTPHTFAFAFAGGFSAPKRAVFYGVELSLGRATHRLICVSRSEGEQAAKLRVVPADRIRVVENGIDPAPFLAAPSRREARAALGLEAGARLVAIVALVNPAKGQLEAVEALALVPEAKRPTLLLVGGVSDPETSAQLDAAIAARGVAGSVRRLGHRSDVAAWLAASDLVLVPSRWEGMPYALLEAMASSRAVLATATNGSKDAVVDGATGRLVDVGDAAAMARALEEMLADGARLEAMGAAGRARVLERFTVASMLERTAAVYEEALAS